MALLVQMEQGGHGRSLPGWATGCLLPWSAPRLKPLVNPISPKSQAPATADLHRSESFSPHFSTHRRLATSGAIRRVRNPQPCRCWSYG
jgi:hypothetical protein